MAEEKPKTSRKLAAILAADIAGYSALMGADEEATVRDLKAHQGVVLPMIAEHGGRVIDTAGDGILAEFASVVNAVECAIAIQKMTAEHNASVPTGRRMQFRIGINLGDVIYDEQRVYGDGVNIAARLESIAEPGGICVSAVVHDQVRYKLSLDFSDLGEQTLKNIAQPVRVYRVGSTQSAAPSLSDRPVLALPDKPSIAVLPFTNLSGEMEQEYFSDGVTADIITELSRFSELFVIARNSSFTYKGRAVDVRQIGRELGVRYLLEGSIRRSGDRVRITGQLIDAQTRTHRWAERYDRKLEDVFAVQDEVARTIAAILPAHLNKAEAERTLLKPPITWEAYDYYMRGVATFGSFLSSLKVDDLYEARRLLQQSLSMDPCYARAYATLAYTHSWSYSNPIDDDYLDYAVINRAYDFARNAIQLDPNLPQAHSSCGVVLIWKGKPDEAIAAFERAIALNPNFSDWRLAVPLIHAGQATRAIQVIEEHTRLDPFYPPSVLAWSGFAYYVLGKYSEALPSLRACVSQVPNYRAGRLRLAATYAQLGRLDEARAEVSEVLRLEPTYTIDGTQRRLSIFKSSEDAERFFDGLRKAGLPEK